MCDPDLEAHLRHWGIDLTAGWPTAASSNDVIRGWLAEQGWWQDAIAQAACPRQWFEIDIPPFIHPRQAMGVIRRRLFKARASALAAAAALPAAPAT